MRLLGLIASGSEGGEPLTYLKVLLDIIVKGYVSPFNPVLVLINSQGISVPDFQM